MFRLLLLVLLVLRLRNGQVTCAFCLRRFWSAEDLRRHMRTHSGERPFSCRHCGRRFTLKHSMLRHQRKHRGDAAAAAAVAAAAAAASAAAAAGKSDDDDDDEEDEDEDDEDFGDTEEDDDDADDESLPDAAAAAAAWRRGVKLRDASDLIGNLLGLTDNSLVEQLMSKPADDAARLLGVGNGAPDAD